MRRFANRRPFAFSVLVTLVLFGLDLASRAVFPRAPVGNIEKLPQDAFEPPVGLGLILSDMRSPDTLFWALATMLALGLLVWTGWLGEAGFNRMSQWRNLRLLLFPLLVCALTLSGGLFGSGPASLVSAFLTVLVAAFGEEIVFRGLLWRALAPAGPVRAVILTSLLSGLLVLGMTATEGPWPEAVRLTALTFCGGFTYGALRWRTTSIWPVILVHTALRLRREHCDAGRLHLSPHDAPQHPRLRRLRALPPPQPPGQGGRRPDEASPITREVT